MQKVFSCNNYEVNLEALIFELESLKPKRVLIHAPDGLKHIYTCISSFLSSLYSIEVYYSTSPGYGACDIPIEEAEVLDADLIVHIGHEEYPLAEKSSWRKRVIYLPVFYMGLLDSSLKSELTGFLYGFNAKTITVSSTITDLYFKEEISRVLHSNGFRVLSVEKPVLGCMYSHVVALDNIVDAHVIIAGGLFHALGLALVSAKPVVAVDPYMKRVWDASSEAGRILRKRMYQLFRVKESAGSKMGLIIGARPGQYRPRLVESIERQALLRGYRVYKISSSYLSLERLIAIDASLNLDFYVVSSCPRLPIDDLAEFHKPVLTPGEFWMLISSSEKYVYPW